MRIGSGDSNPSPWEIVIFLIQKSSEYLTNLNQNEGKKWFSDEQDQLQLCSPYQVAIWLFIRTSRNCGKFNHHFQPQQLIWKEHTLHQDD